jgi:molecular chaperone DnaK
MKIRKTVGIDLGTTNSVIALLDATDSALLTGRDEQGRTTFPSVVAYDTSLGRLVSGRAAHALRGSPVADAPGSPPTLPLSSVKRFMGLDRRFPLGPESLTPPEASAHVLRLLRDVLARTLNDPTYLLDSAVITMPAYFNHEQIEATRRAGELADFEVAELLHEPTAAAMYYSWLENHGDATYLVYDLGGGTFDVSIIRRRLGDYEVLSVSGDPFLGGDDFDRLLATHLIESGSVRAGSVSDGVSVANASGSDGTLFDLATPDGAVNFARLVHVAEGIKTALTDAEQVTRSVPAFLPGLDLEATIDRATFNRLIKDKVDRTIDCCHEALARARERAGVRLGDIDHVILVGGSSRVPLVRERVRTAFCNPDLPEHVRRPDPLLHEPDLCVAYGAALRAGTHGTRYQFGVRGSEFGVQQGTDGLMELHLKSPVNTRETNYQIAGLVRTPNPEPRTPNCLDGASVRIRSLATGLTDEAFLDERGTFSQDVELQPETDNALELVVCDGGGAPVARVVTAVRHQAAGRPLGRAVLPTQLITKPLQIDVLNHARQRVKQVVAPVGATLPGVFHCTCRTRDQAGRVVVPIYEENRVIKEMVLDRLDPSLPVGSPVEIELTIDVKHTIAVRVCVRQGEQGERTETATIEPAPPAERPTRADVEEVRRRIDELLPQFSGAFRSQARARADRLRDDLLEALRYDDEPKSIQRMAELRDLLQQLETGQGQALDPPWPRFAQIVKDCLDLAVSVAKSSGREREELFEYIHAQERYAEKAYEEHNQALYRECRDNLVKYGGYLDGLLRDALPRPVSRPPEEEARDGLDRFRAFLGSVWKQVKAKERTDLDARMKEIAGQAGGLSRRLTTDPVGVIRDVRRLGTEVAKIEEMLDGQRRPPSGDDAGLLEGSK